MNPNRLGIFMLLALLLGGDGAEPLQAQILYGPGQDSRLWIEGRSNINGFECGATVYDLEASVGGDEEGNDQVAGRLAIAVDGFACGDGRMDRDLKKALQVERFPQIHFVFHRGQLIEPGSQGERPYKGRIWGQLTVAGVSRPIECLVEGEVLADGSVRVYGGVAVRMSDYQIKPPTRLWGLVKVRDQLTVRFDFLLRPVAQPNSTLPPGN
ncbi:MAG: hypothetical protein GKR89_29220 [Candidatus Latescibacteria bacterium]|nr:hypothetical protein [Candidatus Latescibacterota bacterium]